VGVESGRCFYDQGRSELFVVLSPGQLELLRPVLSDVDDEAQFRPEALLLAFPVDELQLVSNRVQLALFLGAQDGRGREDALRLQGAYQLHALA